MANFEEIKAGGWNDEDPLTGDEMSSIQDTLMKAPNFVEGGEYDPTAKVKITGEFGIEIDNLFVMEELTLLSNARIKGGFLTRTKVTLSSWSTDTKYHSILSGSIVRVINSVVGHLRLNATGAVHGDELRVSHVSGAQLLVYNFDDVVHLAEVAEGGQLWFVYDSTDGWLLG